MPDWISIIVPVYNSEVYLAECIESICRQTYHALQIILVDDGSTDTSGVICDRYAEKDKRIQVIHQKNAGIGAARNTGLRAVCGKFIGFVDSDDILSEDMYQNLLTILNEYGADISICAETSCKKELTTGRNQTVLELTGQEAVTIMLRGKPFNFEVWNRLYRKNVLENMFFLEGTGAEDMDFSYRALVGARKVVYSADKQYYYRIVETSWAHKTFEPYHLQTLDILKLIEEDIKVRFPALEVKVKNRRVNCMTAYLRRMKEAGYQDEKIAEDMLDFIRKHIWNYIKSSYNASQKMLAAVTCVSPQLAYMFYRIVRKKI